jgi:SAM-dependent methyltransferase
MVHDYDISYFAARNQDRDRPALWFYERIIRRCIPGGSILDYGCGTGFLLRRLSHHYAVHGFDVAPHARAATRANVPGVVVYDQVETIPQNYFTGIVSLHVLEHIIRADIPAVLACWHAALLPGGRVLCVVPDLNGRGHQLSGKRWNGFGDPSHVTLLGYKDWLTIFTTAGFSVRQVGTDGMWCLPYRPGKSKFVDGIRFSIPTIVQFVSGRLMLPPGNGESSVFILEKDVSLTA